MNVVVPYCECPRCSYWGLHYMAAVETHEYPRVIVQLVEKKTAWYDGRDEPDVTLVQEHKIVYKRAQWVVRECLDCSHEFTQHWREWDDW